MPIILRESDKSAREEETERERHDTQSRQSTYATRMYTHSRFYGNESRDNSQFAAHARRRKRDTALFTQSNYRDSRSRFLNSAQTHWSQIGDADSTASVVLGGIIYIVACTACIIDSSVFLLEIHTHTCDLLTILMQTRRVFTIFSFVSEKNCA